MINVHGRTTMYRDLEWDFQPTIDDIAAKSKKLEDLKAIVNNVLCEEGGGSGAAVPLTCSGGDDALTKAAAQFNFKHHASHEHVVDLFVERDTVRDMLHEAVRGDPPNEALSVDQLVNNAIRLATDGAVADTRKRWVHEVTKRHAKLRGCDPLSSPFRDENGEPQELLRDEAANVAFLNRSNDDLVNTHQNRMLTCQNALADKNINVNFDARSFTRPDLGLCPV